MQLLRAYFWLSLFTLWSASALAQDDNYRISDNITPSFQKIHLNIDPDSPVFNGETTIDIEIKKTTNIVEFYQLELNIEKAELIDDTKVIPLTVSSHAYDIQHAKSTNTLALKKYKLHIVFSGKVNNTSDGMYLSKFEGNNYIFTQFEDMHARRAFPSFDEPGFKIPYQLTITAPEKLTVVSNTLVKKRSVKDGLQTVEFNRTQPMPSYIIAFAVGELDSADIPGLSIPGKIYTPKGQANKTKFIARHTAEILTCLEGYFGIDYPFEKIDFIAVPNFTHGAMENAGLVTFRSSYLLLDDEPNLTEQGAPLNVVAHELAHMWYGNLVTMAWWDDLWLNEAFASWMATKVMITLYPEQNFQARLVQEGAFSADSNPTTKPVKKEVKNQTDVMDGLGLNYSKGESTLQLIENLVGEKPFQKGIQKYMHNNAWGNAQADDLWAVLSSVADFDVPAMMKTYLEQPAYPLVEFNPDGTVTQTRYRLQGAQVSEQEWIIPLNIRYKKTGEIKHTQLFLKDKSKIIAELADAQWIFPNEKALGYMRWKISNTQLNALLDDINVLDVKEKKSLLYNTEALFSAGEIDLSHYMTVLDVLADDRDPIVGLGVVAAFKDLTYLIDEENKILFGKFVQRKILHWFKRLGVTQKADESSDTSRLRNAVFGVLSAYTDNTEIKDISVELTQKYLTQHTSVPRGIAVAAMSNVARTGDASWFDKFKHVYVQNSDANVRGAIGSAMAFSQNDNITKTLDFSLTEDVSPANVISLVAGASSVQDNHDTLYLWLEKHFEQLIKKMPAYHVARLPEYVATSCNQHDIDNSITFFADRKQHIDGMARSFDIALSESKQCLALKEANQAAFNAYLKVDK